MTPLVGDLIESTVGKVVDRLVDTFLPASMSTEDRSRFMLEARRIAAEEARAAAAGIESARELASKEAAGAPAWTGVLTATHRPLWSFMTLAVFLFTVLAPYAGYPALPLTEIHKEIMQTVIIFYFGGRSVEKAIGSVWGGRSP